MTDKKKFAIVGSHPWERIRLTKALLLIIDAIKWVLVTVILVYKLVISRDFFSSDSTGILWPELLISASEYLVLSGLCLLELYAVLYQHFWSLLVNFLLQATSLGLNYLFERNFQNVIVVLIAIEMLVSLTLAFQVRRNRPQLSRLRVEI